MLHPFYNVDVKDLESFIRFEGRPLDVISNKDQVSYQSDHQHRDSEIATQEENPVHYEDCKV